MMRNAEAGNDLAARIADDWRDPFSIALGASALLPIQKHR
jgi:hypothetical protein